MNFDLPFHVELHLDDVLEVFLVSWISLLKNLDKNTKGRFTAKIIMINLLIVEIFNFSTFGKIQKARYKNLSYKKVKGPKKAQCLNVFWVIYQKLCFFCSCDLIVNFFQNFSQKCARSNFLVELHLDDVLEVLLVVELKCLYFRTVHVDSALWSILTLNMYMEMIHELIWISMYAYIKRPYGTTYK